MPIIKSSIRDVRKNKKQRAINSAAKARLKTTIKNAKNCTAENKNATLNTAYKVIDKAVKTRLIHLNTGARYKSNITTLQTKKFSNTSS